MRKGWVAFVPRKSTRLFSEAETISLRFPLAEALMAAAPGDRVRFSVYSGDVKQFETKGEFFLDKDGLNLKVSQIKEPRPGLGDENPSYEFDRVILEARRRQFLRTAAKGEGFWLVKCIYDEDEQRLQLRKLLSNVLEENIQKKLNGGEDGLRS